MTNKDMNKHIAFIGGGNMARSLIGGMITNGWPVDRIHVSDKADDQLATLSTCFPGIRTYRENAEAVAQADIIVLAVKPQILAMVARELAPSIDASRHLLISIAAGLHSSDIDRWLGGNKAVVRCMPNTPALVQSGATGLYANELVSDEQRNQAESVLRSVGSTLWVDDESLIDAVTAVSGSGPAYLFLVMEAMEEAGVQLGLDREAARLLSIETAFGAAKLALESDDDPATLRRKVSSPGGTTEQAIKVMEDKQLRLIFAEAMKAAADRAAELAGQLGAE
jgi:pyrroline-5-carboxylate reductase